MNKYLIIVLAFLIIVIFASESTNKGSEIRHYDNGEVSFDYPITWNVTNGTGSQIVSFTDSSGLNVTIRKQSIPSGYSFKDHLQLNAAGTVDENFKLVSSRNYTVNGTTAYEMNYNLNGKNGQQQRREIFFEKNNLIYSIIYTAPGQIKEGDKTLDTLINSFNIKNSEKQNPNKNTGWAEVIMPSINAEWLITSNSVNTANSVLHISTSYYPGEKGEMALMGHHTTHHAPFLNINQLKAGDSIIIKDYLTQKKYVYQVESNGDIRWGVKGTSIKYQPSEEPKLFLITCYPPGYSRAAWIVHCKLVSVQPLS